MLKRLPFGTILALVTVLLLSSCLQLIFLIDVNGNRTSTTLAMYVRQSAAYDNGFSRVAVIVGESLAYDIPLLQIQRLLEHEGLVYDIVSDQDFAHSASDRYMLLIVIGESQPTELSATEIEKSVEAATGLIWIGDCLPASLHPLFGIVEATEDKEPQRVDHIVYGDVSAKVFDETLHSVESPDADVQGYFVDNTSQQISPAELSYRRDNASGLAHYFAYDVCSWWGADLSVPWLRAHRLQLAVDNILSSHLTVRLAPYPRNLRSVFICRVEDVDPSHSHYEWLSRAYSYLDYYSARNAPLTISLIPVYLEPAAGLEVGLGDEMAATLRRWLSNVLLKGGTLVEHGFTHQYGEKKTAVAPEFFDDESGEWLSLVEQMDRMAEGANQIHSDLGFTVRGFEAPHYLANHDTYVALGMLGFRYVNHNTDTPYFDRYGLAEELINIPETLGFIPLGPEQDLEGRMKANMDMLYSMGGVMLLFNHLFEDEALRIGERLLDHAISKNMIWYTNTDGLSDFWHQRLNAYSGMDVRLEGDIEVALGSSNRAGLTLVLQEETEIKSVSVNGVPWPVFNQNYVILPVLPKDCNTIAISLSEDEGNPNLPYGMFLAALSTVISVALFRSVIRKGQLVLLPRFEWVRNP